MVVTIVQDSTSSDEEPVSCNVPDKERLKASSIKEGEEKVKKRRDLFERIQVHRGDLARFAFLMVETFGFTPLRQRPCRPN